MSALTEIFFVSLSFFSLCFFLLLYKAHRYYNIKTINFNYFVYFFFLIFSGIKEDIRDQAEVSFGSIQPSLSSSDSDSSDSDSSIATRRANMEATSCRPVLRSISFCSDFSTLRSVMPVKKIIDYFNWTTLHLYFSVETHHHV